MNKTHPSFQAQHTKPSALSLTLERTNGEKVKLTSPQMEQWFAYTESTLTPQIDRLSQEQIIAYRGYYTIFKLTRR